MKKGNSKNKTVVRKPIGEQAMNLVRRLNPDTQSH